MSIFGREKLKIAVACVEHLYVLGIGQGTFTLLFLILLTNPPNPWLFSINSDLFFTFIALKMISSYPVFVCLRNVYFLH